MKENESGNEVMSDEITLKSYSICAFASINELMRALKVLWSIITNPSLTLRVRKKRNGGLKYFKFFKGL